MSPDIGLQRVSPVPPSGPSDSFSSAPEGATRGEIVNTRRGREPLGSFRSYLTYWQNQRSGGMSDDEHRR